MNRARRFHDVCWITDYFVDECTLRACIYSRNPLHPCVFHDQAAEDVA